MALSLSHRCPVMALNFGSPLCSTFTGSSGCSKRQNVVLCFKANNFYGSTRSKTSCAVNLNRAQPDEGGNLFLDSVMDKARELWDSAPQPVKCFPWNRAFDNFIQLVLDLVLSVLKFLYIPVMAITSVSEMSYCAHERKLILVPISLLIGVALAGVFRKKALEQSLFLKDAEVPWHLISMSIFFILIKLPGPYYPYWGRIFIPHIANGGLIRTLWFLFSWSRKSLNGGNEV